MNTPQAYPLQWPAGWPRTQFRTRSQFKTSLASALSNLKKQIELMGGKSVVLSSNATLGHENPKDPSVVAYFTWNEIQMAIPCDRWYAVLGVDQNSSRELVKQAYLDAVKRTHPDTGGSHEAFIKVQIAWEQYQNL